MTLPKLAVLTYKTKLISDETKEIEFRPFLVKEEKMLLTAMEGGETEEIVSAVSKILKSCILSSIDIDKLPMFDIEKLFIEIRKKSVGETVELMLRHPDQTECDHAQQVTVVLDSLTVNRPAGHSPKIKLTDTIGVKMRYPTSKILEGHTGNDVKATFDLIAKCIECVYDQDTVYNEFTLDEISEWIEQLNESQLNKILDFFKTMPELIFKVNYTCDKCKQQVDISLKGIRDFFI